MKKRTLATLLACLLLVVSLAACGDTEATTDSSTDEQTGDVSIPVKFGTVTSVGPLGDTAEIISLTVSDGVTQVDPERAVYVSAVDYIFTQASPDLTELSVFGFAENGDKIVSFTMPPELIASLRQIESEGSWGTEGFCAWFGINDDAYNVLVSGSKVTEE